MIPHSRPLMHPDDLRAVAEVLERGMLAGGGKTAEFEQAMGRYIGRAHASSASSGTAALYLTLRALGIGPGAEVVIPAYVCSALLHAVRMTGAEPVLADSGEEGFHPDADTVRRTLSPRTGAVIFAHLFGEARDIRDIIALGAPVIEDCAMAVGSEVRGRKSGNLGSAAAVFSFYATKVLACGEGGMALSDDAAMIERVRDLSEYADKIDDVLRFNLKITDLAAALGLSQLGRLESMIARRRELAVRYASAFRDLNWELPVELSGCRHIYYRYVVGSDRTEALRQSLRERGVRAERPVHAPLSRYPGTTAACPNAERAWRRALSIPLYPALGDDEVETVIRAVRAVSSTAL